MLSLTLERSLQIFLPHRCADEQLLPCPLTQRDRFPAVLRRHGDVYLNLAARVPHRADYAGYHRTDSRILLQQPLQHSANSVDDAVFDLELVLSGAQAHRRLSPTFG